MTISQFLVIEYQSLSVFIYMAKNCKQILLILSLGKVRHHCALIQLFWQARVFPTSHAGGGFSRHDIVFPTL